MIGEILMNEVVVLTGLSAVVALSLWEVGEILLSSLKRKQITVKSGKI